MKMPGLFLGAIGVFWRSIVLVNPLLEEIFPIFMFHRILKPGTVEYCDEHLIAFENQFDEMITFIKKHFEIVDLMSRVRNNDSGKTISCAITFDDGWLDNYEVAFPILKKHDIPATIFLCAGMVGTSHPFWFERTTNLINTIFKSREKIREKSEYFGNLIPGKLLGTIINKKEILWHTNNELKKKSPVDLEKWIEQTEKHFSVETSYSRSVMDWEEVREMSRNGISFGSHGMNHHILTCLKTEEKIFEITQSKKILCERNIKFVPALSFPNGNYDQETLNIAEEAGYKLLLSASINYCGDGHSPLLRHRINISNMTSSNLNRIFYQIIKAKFKNKI